MATLTPEQVKRIVENAPPGADPRKILAGLVERGHTVEGLNTAQATTYDRVAEETAGNQFAEPDKKGLFGSIRDFAVGVVGGGKLAEGAGLALAAPKIQAEQAAIFDESVRLQTELVKLIKEKKSAGLDTASLQDALTRLEGDMQIGADTSKDFTDALPTNKQVIGSAVRLAGTATAGTIGGAVSKAVGAARPGLVSGALQGAKVGAITGAAEGAIHGGGIAAEQDLSAAGIAAGATGGAVLGGATGGVLGGTIGAVSGKLKANEAIRAERMQLLQSRPDSRVAKYTLSGQGQLKTDPIAQEAIKQGVDEGTIATIKGASPADKARAAKALDILEQGKRDPKFKAVNRPSDVIGESVMERFKVVNTANQKAAAQLDTVAKSLQGKQADPVPAVRAFLDDLEDMGVSVKNGRAIYEGSDLEGLAGPQKVIDNVVKRMTSVSDDAYDLHRLKRFIDENVEYGSSGEGITGRAEGVIKRLRSNVDGVLDTSFPEYNEVNSTYSATRSAIDDFASAAGSKFNPNDANAEKRIGTLARRILSNAGSRTDVLNTLQNLQDVAETYGGTFDDDIITQTVFVNDLERLFGSQAPTSLAGEVSKGVSQAKGVVGAMRNAQGLFDLALDVGAQGLEKARGIDEEGLIRALRELLKS